MPTTYDSVEWRRARTAVLARDAHRCVVSSLLGGRCFGPLHVHHIVPVVEGGTNDLDNLASVCAVHHPAWEGLRRQLLRRREPPRCPHRHVHAEARRACEARLARLAS